MKPENVIEVKNITKKFKVYLDKGHTLKEKTLFRNRRKYEERNVLNGISFEVKKGEAVGLIGHNGCGKSTTLKLLTKIMYPDSGTIEMKGRVSSLIELGAGFHPDMSGRDNIYTNASIFGLTKKEIDARLDDIIAFSELEEFIDNPVRTYSSGMYMRLAFSVAINVDADILLIDEILAVGDAAFQAKCFNKLREIKSHGTTIVIVSHSMSQIEQICNRSIWIHDGLIKEEGKPRIVDPHYMEYMSEKAAGCNMKKAEGDKKRELEIEKVEKEKKKETVENKKRWGSKEVIMESVRVVDVDGKEQNEFYNTQPFSILIEYKANKIVDDAVIGVAIYRDDQTYIYGSNTLIDYSEPTKLNTRGEIRLNIERLPVIAGNYTMDLAFHKPDGFNYDLWREVCLITIKNNVSEVGIVSVPHNWIID